MNVVIFYIGNFILIILDPTIARKPKRDIKILPCQLFSLLPFLEGLKGAPTRNNKN
jgi:hypothetical protein